MAFIETHNVSDLAQSCIGLIRGYDEDASILERLEGLEEIQQHLAVLFSAIIEREYTYFNRLEHRLNQAPDDYDKKGNIEESLRGLQDSISSHVGMLRELESYAIAFQQMRHAINSGEMEKEQLLQTATLNFVSGLESSFASENTVTILEQEVMSEEKRIGAFDSVIEALDADLVALNKARNGGEYRPSAPAQRGLSFVN